jgi:hypothetical protein
MSASLLLDASAALGWLQPSAFVSGLSRHDATDVVAS